MATASQARETIGKVIKARDGGVYGLAAISGVHFTRIYSFLAGGGLGEENARKLRAALPEVDASAWADAFAPTATDVASEPAA